MLTKQASRLLHTSLLPRLLPRYPFRAQPSSGVPWPTVESIFQMLTRTLLLLHMRERGSSAGALLRASAETDLKRWSNQPIKREKSRMQNGRWRQTEEETLPDRDGLVTGLTPQRKRLFLPLRFLKERLSMVRGRQARVPLSNPCFLPLSLRKINEAFLNGGRNKNGGTGPTKAP